MEFLNFSTDQFKVFLLILVRISVVLYLFPVFSSTMIPGPVKAGLSLVMALALFPAITVNPALFPRNVPELLVLGLSELFVGLVLSLAIRLFLSAVELAGGLIGVQMGFAIINVLDPQTGSQVDIIGQIGSLVVLTLFLALNGHHALIEGLVESFRTVEIGRISLHKGLLLVVFSQVTDMFVIGVKMGAPAIVALLFTNAGFGIIAKFVPQMNILMAAFPVQIIVGLTFLGLLLPILVIVTQTYLTQLPSLLTSLLKSMGGG
ncbi:MAG: flagellar biosynthetic protein FliR [Pseudomonadota bacterium]